MNRATRRSAIGMEFDAIAAVALGGTSFERGEGWLFGTLLGVLAVGILRNGLEPYDGAIVARKGSPLGLLVIVNC